MSTKEKPIKHCPECSGDGLPDFDPFGFGQLLDEHMDIVVDDEALNKRIHNAMDMSRRLGGEVAGGLEGDLDDLTKPKLTWQDFIRHAKARLKQGASKSNWNSPRRKLLFSGIYAPTKIDYSVKFLIAYDCSGSMSKKAITYGISQVQALNDRGEGWCLPWDAEPYFDAMVKIKSAKPEELKNAKYKGGGGTVLSPVFEKYEAQIGKVDIIIIISDFYLADEKLLHKLKQPINTEVVWLSMNGNPKFKPPFGRLFSLMND